jgi:hypothetical protein
MVFGIGIAALLASEVSSSAAEATTSAAGAEGGLSMMLGLHQWLLLGGGNVAAQYKTSRWVFEYSHGQALHLNRTAALTLTTDERNAGVRVDMPWTTGGGVGVRITRNLHALLEVKVHRYELYGSDRNQNLSYLTFTVGPGLFYEIHLWHGLFLQPLVRWWPNVGDTLDESSAPSFTRPDGGLYRPKAQTQGVFANVNLGWAF